jgi:hypothetical protein
LRDNVVRAADTAELPPLPAWSVSSGNAELISSPARARYGDRDSGSAGENTGSLNRSACDPPRW